MTEPIQADVLIRTNGPIGHISLNRPKALHALTLDCLLYTSDAADE